jgi:hypothetical protein
VRSSGEPMTAGEESSRPMSRKRRSYEAGHKPKYLVIIDESPECDRAVYYASRRAPAPPWSCCW